MDDVIEKSKQHQTHDKNQEENIVKSEKNNAQDSVPPIDKHNASDPPYPSEIYAWYVVGVLMIVYVFSFMDRQILGLLIGSIKSDFGVSDTAIGFLTGTAFALFYSILGVPIGRLADSKNRVGIIAVGLVIWSFFTTASGMVGRFATLALARVGVGVGEATLSPSAYSLITDYFRPTRQALAISIYGAGIYIGSGLAYVLGGYVVRFVGTAETVAMPVVGEVRSWQSVFFLIGIPGLLFALALLTVREPLRRGLRRAGSTAAAASVPMVEVYSYIVHNWRTFLCHNVGIALCSFISYGSTIWIPEFLNRTYGMPRGDAGISYGYIVMSCGTLGIIFGGYFAGVLAKRGYTDAKLRSALTAALLHIPFGIMFPLMPTADLALACLLGAVFFAAMPFGVGPAAIQEMMPNRMRGQASAIYLLVVNLIGLGLGPLAVGASNDYIFGEDGVNKSLMMVSTISGVVASTLLVIGMKHFKTSLANLASYQDGVEVKQYTQAQMIRNLIIGVIVIFAIAGTLVFLDLTYG